MNTTTTHPAAEAKEWAEAARDDARRAWFYAAAAVQFLEDAEFDHADEEEAATANANAAEIAAGLAAEAASHAEHHAMLADHRRPDEAAKAWFHAGAAAGHAEAARDAADLTERERRAANRW